MLFVNIFSALIFSSILLSKLLWSAFRMVLLVLGFYVCILAVLFLILLFVAANISAVFQAFHTKETVPAIYQEQTSVSQENEVKSTDLSDQIEYWQTQLKKQPTSRDILLNLSALYQANHQDGLAKEYKDKAEQIDPNYANPVLN